MMKQRERNAIRILRLSRLVLLLGLTLILTACSSWRSALLPTVVRDPTLTVQQIAFTHLGLDSVDLVLLLRVHNPNSYGIDLTGFRYHIRLNNRVDYSGENQQHVHLSQGQDSPLQMPIKLKTSAARRLFAALNADGKLHYQVDAQLSVASVFAHAVDISTRQQGDLILPHLPQLAVDSLKVKSLNLDTANLIMRLKLTNPNNFPMAIKNINYSLSVADQRWISGRYDKNLPLPPHKAGYANIQISIHLDRIRRGLLQQILKGNFHNYTLQGSFVLDSPFPSLRHLSVPIHYRPQ